MVHDQGKALEGVGMNKKGSPLQRPSGMTNCVGILKGNDKHEQLIDNKWPST